MELTKYSSSENVTILASSTMYDCLVIAIDLVPGPYHYAVWLSWTRYADVCVYESRDVNQWDPPDRSDAGLCPTGVINILLQQFIYM